MEVNIINYKNEYEKYFYDINIEWFASAWDLNSVKFKDFETYFNNFFNFCFELSLDNMVEDSKNFKIWWCSFC